MKFDFLDRDRKQWYGIVFDPHYPQHVTVVAYNNGGDGTGGWGWSYPIQDGQIVWRNDDWMYISQGAKQYFERIVKLKGFW